MDLRDYLSEHKIGVTAFAEMVGVTPTAMYRYIAGDRVPRREVMLRIKAATNGCVRPDDFFQPSEAA